MIYFIVAIIIFGVLVLVFINRFGRHMPTPLNKEHYRQSWAELLDKVKTPEGMIVAVINADKLLDEALKKRHFRGKTMGERLVAAQRTLNNNDSVWFAHKLRNRLVHEPSTRLKKSEAQKALAGFKQALSDLGAL